MKNMKRVCCEMLPHPSPQVQGLGDRGYAKQLRHHAWRLHSTPAFRWRGTGSPWRKSGSWKVGNGGEILRWRTQNRVQQQELGKLACKHWSNEATHGGGASRKLSKNCIIFKQRVKLSLNTTWTSSRCEGWGTPEGAWVGTESLRSPRKLLHMMNMELRCWGFQYCRNLSAIPCHTLWPLATLAIGGHSHLIWVTGVMATLLCFVISNTTQSLVVSNTFNWKYLCSWWLLLQHWWQWHRFIFLLGPVQISFRAFFGMI